MGIIPPAEVYVMQHKAAAINMIKTHIYFPAIYLIQSTKAIEMLSALED